MHFRTHQDLSCVNTSTALFTIVALFVILRARSGGAAALQTLAGDLVGAWDPLVAFPPALAWFLLAAMVTAVAAFFSPVGSGASLPAWPRPSRTGRCSSGSSCSSTASSSSWRARLG